MYCVLCFVNLLCVLILFVGGVEGLMIVIDVVSLLMGVFGLIVVL